MNHNGTIQLETERLILRRFIVDDAEMMFKNWASDSDVTRYMTWFPHKDVRETERIINEWIAEYTEIKRYQWAIVLKGINEPIGSIGVVRQSDKFKKAEMGYCIGKAFWYNGYTAEALVSVMDYLFNTVGFNRISALHDVRNINSGNVMKKSGMQYEGTLREVGLTKEGSPLSFCVYSALKGEWENK